MELRYTILLAFFLNALWPIWAYASSPNHQIEGYWIPTDASALLVIVKEQQSYAIRIVKVRDVLHNSGDSEYKPGSTRRDEYNPDSKLRDRELKGLKIGEKFKFEDGVWTGKIYDPGSGSTYRCEIKVMPDGLLQVRGYIGIPLLGRTVYFHPADRLIKRFEEMVQPLEELNVYAAPEESSEYL